MGETTKTAGATRSATGRIEITASPERVWKALTDAAELVRWFPLEARVEPGEGGSIFLSWKNEFAAESKIVAWEPVKRLAISWGWGADAETQPQVTEYRLEAADGGRTVVKVVTSGFPDDPSWDAYVDGTNRGWLFELQSLKQYLERHEGQEREVIYLRRRTSISAAEVWERMFGEVGLGGLPGGVLTPRGSGVRHERARSIRRRARRAGRRPVPGLQRAVYDPRIRARSRALAPGMGRPPRRASHQGSDVAVAAGASVPRG